MKRWACPACGRTFGRSRQGHVCVPVRTLDDFLAAQPDELRGVFEAVIEHVSQLEDIVIEPGDVYLMLKRSRTFATLTPRRHWIRMWFSLPYAVDDDRIQSRTRDTGHDVGHHVRLSEPGDVDNSIRAWLMEAYDAYE